MPQKVRIKLEKLTVPKIELKVPIEETIGSKIKALDIARAPSVSVYNVHELLVNLKPLVRRTEEEVIPVFKSKFSRKVIGFLNQFDLIVPTSHRSPFTVLDFLREYPIFNPEDDLNKILEELEDKRARGAPVVDENGNLVGVIDYFDIVRTLRRNGASSELKVKDIAREGYTINQNEKVNKAWHKLINKFIPGLVVLNDEGKPVGIITYKEFVKTNRWFFHREDEARPSTKVKTIMLRGVPVLEPEDPITIAADKMVSMRVPVLPVSDGRAVFIEDVAKALSVSTKK
ncbi:hypothetical protein EYM_07285 [Ignicoccus islandicus DSM 13165]|uniref:CBS domain-containing protein n=1 Tax=Ignicoccus islandicus DSM 13165 TaxID=940295 RepID=A0A0U3G3L6_9CREN|nr:CBS domain-containing protein [Ignicoccus islandicus]ALU12764.1 hypothetical protein EYM_07285 [Ignicoccus islandicus DSM 13165]